MGPHKTIALALLATALSGCIQTRQNVLDNLHTASIDVVNAYAAEMGAYASRFGHEQATEKGMESVKRQLKDPESARFQNIQLTDHNGGLVLCGEINAKNSYGGYVGFKRFVAGTNSATMQETNRRHPEVAAASNAGIVAACGYR